MAAVRHVATRVKSAPPSEEGEFEARPVKEWPQRPGDSLVRKGGITSFESEQARFRLTCENFFKNFKLSF